MIKVCVLIGEGDSERYFLPSLIEKRAAFVPQLDKDSFLYQKGDSLFWFFPFPPHVTTPRGGKDRLKRIDTYRQASAIIGHQMLAITEGDFECHYRILVDNDSCDATSRVKRVEEIDKIFCDSGVPHHTKDIIVVENVIEHWYFSGLTEGFPHFEKGSGYEKYLAQNPETIPEPKKILTEILDPEVRGAIKIAQTIGSHFDVEKAIAKSKSFNTFWTSLTRDSLV